MLERFVCLLLTFLHCVCVVSLLLFLLASLTFGRGCYTEVGGGSLSFAAFTNCLAYKRDALWLRGVEALHVQGPQFLPSSVGGSSLVLEVDAFEGISSEEATTVSRVSAFKTQSSVCLITERLDTQKLQFQESSRSLQCCCTWLLHTNTVATC